MTDFFKTHTNPVSTCSTIEEYAGSSTDTAPFHLTNAQFQMIQTALQHIVVPNPASMEFTDGSKIYVPTELPLGEQFLGVNSGSNVDFGTYVNFGFSRWKS